MGGPVSASLRVGMYILVAGRPSHLCVGDRDPRSRKIHTWCVVECLTPFSPLVAVPMSALAGDSVAMVDAAVTKCACLWRKVQCHSGRSGSCLARPALEH